MRKMILTIFVLATVLMTAEAGLPGGPVETSGSIRPSSWCSLPDADQTVIKVKVVIAQANVRLAPQGDSDILIVANRGQIFDVVEKAGDWYQILLPEGRKGFIFFSTVVEQAVEAPKTPVIRPEPVKPPKTEAPVVKPEPVQPPKAEAPVARPEPSKPETVREPGAEGHHRLQHPAADVASLQRGRNVRQAADRPPRRPGSRGREGRGPGSAPPPATRSSGVRSTRPPQ